jgi:hypothetical protein
VIDTVAHNALADTDIVSHFFKYHIRVLLVVSCGIVHWSIVVVIHQEDVADIVGVYL